MKPRCAFSAALFLGLALVSGCGTPQTKVVRDEANGRFELARAQMSFDQAHQAYETGQFDKAIKEINVAIARLDDRAEYHVLKGRILLETHRLEAAMESFERAHELDPSNHESLYFSGIVFQRWSNLEGAIASYRAASELKSDNVQYLLATAECLVAANRRAEARDMIEPRMAYFEHNAALRQLLGQIALLDDQPARAAQLFHEARLLNPEDLMLLEDLARAQFSAGDYARAHHSVTQLRELVADGDRPGLIQLEARCQVMLDRPADARNLFLRLSQLTPADVTVWIELGNVAFEVGDYRRVALCSSRIIALSPDRFEGYLLKGLFEQNAGNPEAAIVNFRKASELAPDVAWPHVLLGMALEERGSVEEALVAYANALKADPQHVEARQHFEQIDPHATLASEPVNDIQP